ncbi:putative trehalose-phosphate phosphatase i [Quercus suber]|uniref:Trehalose-phosphate phosphatase i n=1 Tax=Quercus suber TaxID=58331 RepID=A0AAW0L6V2_QUESU
MGFEIGSNYFKIGLAELYYAGSHGMDIKRPTKGSKHKKVSELRAVSSWKWDVIVKMEEVGVILLSSSEDEKDEMKKKQKRKYEEEYKVVSDLTSFDNLRTMIEAEADAFNRRSRKKKRKKKKRRNNNNQPETKMVGKAEKIIMVKMRQEIEKPIIFITSSEDEDEDANNVKRKKNMKRITLCFQI